MSDAPRPDWPARAAEGLTLPPAYFDDVYAAADDPWRFETSPYEAEKYAATLAALPRPRYGSAFEIGCSIGVLTARLAGRCDRLLAVDVSGRALARARARTAGLPHVRVERLRVPDEFPRERFDFVLLSEVGYYWGEADGARALDEIAGALGAGGELLLVHWTPAVPDYPRTGDAVHAQALARPEFRHVHGERHPQYRLDLLERR